MCGPKILKIVIFHSLCSFQENDPGTPKLPKMVKKGKKRGDRIEKPKSLSQTLTEAKYGKQTYKPQKEVDAKELMQNSNILVQERMSHKILQQAKRMQNDMEEGVDFDEKHLKFVTEEEEAEASSSKSTSKMNFQNLAEEQGEADPNNPDQAVPEVEIDEADNDAFNLFMTSDPNEKGKNLQDLIREKLSQINEAMGPNPYDPDQNLGSINANDTRAAAASQLEPELVQIYTQIGVVMSKFRSTKFPKAFKYIPQLKNWEEALFLTNPDKWTAASVMMATKDFAHAMPEPMAQRYYNLVLLPRVRDEIACFKKLNFHIYEAIMKSVFKPMAFFRGFLLPLAASGNCTLKEATIICSVLREKSIPDKHAWAGMLKIAEMPYNGSNSLFLRTFIEKKYNMPYQVLDALVFHFLKMKDEERRLPVLWHQCFLSFVRHYAKDISEDMRKALVGLCIKQNHGQISGEIKELLLKTLPRDIEIGGVDDYMNI